jgi:L-amino acid N-acyltransferase YncA
VEFIIAESRDLPAIVATYNSTIPSRLVTADLEPVTVESRLEWFNKHSSQKRPLWIVKKNGSYAGWMSFSSFYGRPAYDGTAELSIYLQENFRENGLGKICLTYAMMQAPKLKISTVLGFIFGHNVPSLKLFESAGFKRWGHLPEVAKMDHELRDLIILGKKLT